ncbi:MAG: hypothetical protein ACO20H_09230 [Bacteriovoracaceae bacterium]
MTKKLYIILLFIPVIALSKGRSELYRYTLMRDKVLIDRQLKQVSFHSFFNLEVLLSSGSKSLIGDVKNGNRAGLTSTQKQTNMLNILNNNVNTARYIDANLEAAIPLPSFKVSKFKIDSSLFYNFNIGLSLSIANTTNNSDPEVNLYLKKETRIGVDTYFQNNPSEAYGLRYYQMSRSDLLSVLDEQSLASEGKLFEVDDLNKKEVTYNLDLFYKKAYRNFKLLAEIQEFKIMNGTSTRAALYESRPLLHGRLSFNVGQGQLYFGIHQRFKYALLRGIYAAYDFRVKEDYPFFVLAKISNQFITLNPRFETKYFKVNYTIKTPIENPQDELWHSTLHSLNIAVPFF